MKRGLVGFLLAAGCAASPSMGTDLGFETHFPTPPAVVKDGHRTEYQLHTPDYEYTAGLLKLASNEPLNGKSFQAETVRLHGERAEERRTPFYGLSKRFEGTISGHRCVGYLTQSGDGRILYATVVQIKPNPDRPLELDRVFQQFTEGAKL